MLPGILQRGVNRLFPARLLRLYASERALSDRVHFKAALSAAILAGLLALLALGMRAAQAQNDADFSAPAPDSKPHIADKSVIVQTGDTLQSISMREFRTASLWHHIGEHNRMEVDRELKVGETVNIPTLVKRPAEFARIVYSHGDNAFIRSDGGTSESISRDSQLFLDDVIETGPSGFVSIEFRSGSVINIQPESRVQLKSLACLSTDNTCIIELDAERGDIRTNVIREDGKDTDFKVNTPYASAAVRGTEFDISADQERILVGVTEGSVALSGSEAAVNLDSGFGTRVLEGQGPEEPKALLPAPVFSGLGARVAEGDQIHWWPVHEAIEYEFKLTSDESGKNNLLKRSLATTRTSLDDIDGGEYYVHIRAVDDIGLKGFVLTERIRVAGIDATIGPIELDVTRTGNEVSVQVRNPDQERIGGYEIQIAASEAFEDPISVDIGNAGGAVFLLQPQNVFVRARALLTPDLVSPFGDIYQAN